jgi:hypothetical protein
MLVSTSSRISKILNNFYDISISFIDYLTDCKNNKLDSRSYCIYSIEFPHLI